MAPARAPSESSGSPLWISGALFLAVLCVFGQTYRHEFLSYDDPAYITNNPIVLRGLTLGGMARSLTAVVASLWHPLTLISHMVDVQMFGLNAGAHHLMSAFFHGLNAVLVFHALRLLTGDTWRPAVVAAIFAVHPLHVESVAWASERKDVLSALFFLLALCVYARYVRTRKRRDYAILLACFVLGLASKPMVITLPFVLLLIDYWPLRRAEPLRALVLEKWPLFLITAAAAVMTAWTQAATGAVRTFDKYPLSARVANAIVAYAEYVEQTFLPIHLAVMYQHPRVHIAWGAVAFGAAVIGCITIAALCVWRRHPYALIGWLWFLGMLVPVIGLVQVGVTAHADRYTYLPQVGLLVAVVWTSSEIGRTAGFVRWMMPSAAVVAVVVLAVLAFVQAGHWRNSITLFEHNVHVSPDNPLAHVSLATSYALLGRLDQAEPHFRRAIELNPQQVRAKLDLGKLLIKSNRPAEGAALFEELIQADRLNPDYHVMLALALCSQGKVDEGVSRAQEALHIQPAHERAITAIHQCRSGLRRGE